MLAAGSQAPGLHQGSSHLLPGTTGGEGSAHGPRVNPTKEPVGPPLSPESPADWRESAPAGRGAHGGCRGKAFGDVVRLLVRCFNGAMGMCKTYYGVLRGGIKGREREGSRWTGEEPA